MSNTPDNKDDLVARIIRLEAKIEEMDRRTLSTLAVTDPITNTRMLEITPDASNGGKELFTMRDNNGNPLIRNDTAGGWGLDRPIISYPMYPWKSWTGLQATTTSYQGLWNCGCNVLSKKVDYSFFVEVSAGVTGFVKFTWFKGTETTIFETSVSAGTQLIQSTYLFPSDVYLNGIGFNVYAKLSTGSGTIGVTPFYLQTRGVNT